MNHETKWLDLEIFLLPINVNHLMTLINFYISFSSINNFHFNNFLFLFITLVMQ